VARPVATPPSKSTSALAPRSAERCTAVRECLKMLCQVYRSKIKKKILASHKILKPRTFLLPRTALKNQDCPGYSWTYGKPTDYTFKKKKSLIYKAIFFTVSRERERGILLAS
jgi:hypothetical protein